MSYPQVPVERWNRLWASGHGLWQGTLPDVKRYVRERRMRYPYIVKIVAPGYRPFYGVTGSYGPYRELLGESESNPKLGNQWARARVRRLPGGKTHIHILGPARTARRRRRR